MRGSTSFPLVSYSIFGVSDRRTATITGNPHLSDLRLQNRGLQRPLSTSPPGGVFFPEREQIILKNMCFVAITYLNFRCHTPIEFSWFELIPIFKTGCVCTLNWNGSNPPRSYYSIVPLKFICTPFTRLCLRRLWCYHLYCRT